MNVLLISYGVKEFDGRLAELYKMAKNLGEVTYISCGISLSNKKSEKIVLKKNHKYMSLILYLKFLYTSLIAANRIGKIDILICDNFFASIPVLLIRKIFKPTFIIQDVRELYFSNDAKSASGKIFSKFEVSLMRKSNVVLCANKERSIIMQKEFHLPNKPIVFENIRTLTEPFDKEVLDKKYENDFNYRFNVISTGGISVLRTTDKLVEAMDKLSSDFGLYIIGQGEETDRVKINSIIQKLALKNVKLIDKVSLDELKYIVQQADIGIVNYHQLDLNNKYCASGKVYEYLGEGVPIVTTENPPLKQICESFQIGKADDHFYKGIIEVAENINDYNKNVKKYMEDVSAEENNKKVALQISSILKGISSND